MGNNVHLNPRQIWPPLVYSKPSPKTDCKKIIVVEILQRIARMPSYSNHPIHHPRHPLLRPLQSINGKLVSTDIVQMPHTRAIGDTGKISRNISTQKISRVENSS